MVVVALGPSATVHLLSPVRLRWPASHSIAATPHCIACIGSVKWKWGGIAHLQLQMLLAGLDWPDSTPLGPCLVRVKIQKVFKILRHINHVGTCMEY
jgi:hypothetical protein